MDNSNDKNMNIYRPEQDSIFLDADGLMYDDISLTLIEKQDSSKRGDATFAYLFDVIADNINVGGIHLRLGSTLAYYYAGQIGYWINESHQKRGYATKACLALLPLIKKHGFKRIVIGTDENNMASQRVCEKVGMKLIEIVDTPEWSGLYEEGQRRTCIYEWTIENT